jgi:CRP-like cAMP-binding protein
LDDESAVALTTLRTADATALANVISDPAGAARGLAQAFAAAARAEEAALLDALVRLGRQSALARLAHLLLSLCDRLKDAGLADGDRFSFPLTQEMLADVLGLSIVHVNRTLQHLRRENFIANSRGVMTLRDRRALAVLSDYERHDRRAPANSVPDRQATAVP